jgi:uncharacterized membrane protein YkoI
MKNQAQLVLPIIIIIFLSSCSEENKPLPEVPEDIINESLTLFDGEVIEKKQVIEDGINAWEVKIENSNGAIVKFYWSTTGNSLIKIEGIQSPFDYELNPGMNLINYSTSKTFAISAVKNSSILNWELEKNQSFIGKWVYEFEFEKGSETQKVYIDAANGDVLQVD